MAGVFDIDIFDPDIFDCGDVGPGPVEETDSEALVTGRLRLSPASAHTAKLSGTLSILTGIVISAEVAGKLTLRGRTGCV